MHKLPDSIEIRSTKDGRVFGITDIDFIIEGNEIKITAKIAGDMEAGQEYLDDYSKALYDSITKQMKEQT